MLVPLARAFSRVLPNRDDIASRVVEILMNRLAMRFWLKWKESPEAQAAIPKELVVDILCELVPSLAANIRSGTGKFQSES